MIHTLSMWRVSPLMHQGYPAWFGSVTEQIGHFHISESMSVNHAAWSACVFTSGKDHTRTLILKAVLNSIPMVILVS